MDGVALDRMRDDASMETGGKEEKMEASKFKFVFVDSAS